MGQEVVAASGNALTTSRGVKNTLSVQRGRITHPWSPKCRARPAAPPCEAVTIRRSSSTSKTRRPSS